MKKKKNMVLGFSIMELVVSFVVIAVIAGASTPILFKKSSKMKLKNFNSITTSCDASNSTCSVYGDRCGLFKKTISNNTTTYTCLMCNKQIATETDRNYKYLDKTTCELKSCSSKYGDDCIRCNSTYCSGCKKGTGFNKDNNTCNGCTAGTYSDNKDNNTIRVAEACKTCLEGYYCPDEKMTTGTKYPCFAGYYCPPGTKSSTEHPCPAECYCPKTKMGSTKTTGVNSLNASGELFCPKDENGNAYPCPPGYYCPQGSINPTPCPENTYKSTLGGSTVDKCISCNTVLMNSKSPKASTKQGDCNCADDTYKVKSSTGAVVCGKCSNGTFKRLVAGTTDVYECPPCPAGSYCPTPDKDPVQCSCGQYSTGSATSCSGCAAPNLASTKGSTNSAACKHCDYYQPSKCGCCPANAIECDDNGKATKCKCGYALSNGACTKCADYKINDGTKSSCSSCSASNNQYAPKTGGCGCATCKSNEYVSNHTCKKCSDKWGEHCTSCDSNSCKGCSSGWSIPGEVRSGQTIKKCCKHPSKQADCKENYIYSGASNGACINQKAHSISDGVTDIGTPNGTDCKNSDGACCWGAYDENDPESRVSIKNYCSNAPQNTDYSGCSRRVCTRKAAQIMCTSSARYDFPTLEELKSFVGKTNNDAHYCSTHKKTNAYNIGFNYYGYCPSSDDKRCIVNGTGHTCRPGYIFYGNNGEKLFYFNNIDNFNKNSTPTTTGETGNNKTGHVRCARRWICDGDD